MCADVDTLKALPTLAISEVSSVKGLCEQLSAWNASDTLKGARLVISDREKVISAVRADVTSGNAFKHFASSVKDTRKSEYSILSYTAFFCDYGFSAVYVTCNVIANPGKAMSDSMSYVCQLLYAVSVIATDSDVVRFLNDKEAIARLKTVKAD